MPNPLRKLLAIVMILALPSIVAAGEPQFTRVFGPEVPTGPYKHPACLTELANGDLLPRLLRGIG